MLSVEKLLAVKTIIVHDSCPDGTASAILLRDAYAGQSVTFRFIQYGTAEHLNLTPEPGMLFCDFSPPADRVQEFIDVAAIVLDHHKTAKPVVEALGDNGIFGDEGSTPGVAGATLAYEYVWLPLKCAQSGGVDERDAQFARDFAILAGIRDTWQRQDPRWKAACVQAYILHFFTNDKWLATPLTAIAADWEKAFKPIGEALWVKHEKSVQRIVKEAYRFITAKGTRVVMFADIVNTSDVAEALGSEVDLVVGFLPVNMDGKLKYIFSTRSHTTFDCASFAKANGGGGHLRAAGFTYPVEMHSTLNPFAVTKTLIEAQENQS